MTDKAVPTIVTSFKVFDMEKKQIIRDSSFYNAIVDRADGIGTVIVELPLGSTKVLLQAGIMTTEGVLIYADDIVEATLNGEAVTDKVWWNGEAWQFGGFDEPLSAFVWLKVKGNANEIPWPDIDAQVETPAPAPAQ